MRVFLQSDEFGRETFEYDTEKEAVAGMLRLREEAKKLHDGIKREIGFEV